MSFDKTKTHGVWVDAEKGSGFEQNGIKYTFYGVPLPGQDIPEPTPPPAPPAPKDDDPSYTKPVKPKVYLTQMNMRQLRAECVELEIEYAPGDGKKALVAKIRQERERRK